MAAAATTVGHGSHLAGGNGSREAVLTGLFVLLAFLEEGLRDFDGLKRLRLCSVFLWLGD